MLLFLRRAFQKSLALAAGTHSLGLRGCQNPPHLPTIRRTGSRAMPVGTENPRIATLEYADQLQVKGGKRSILRPSVNFCQLGVRAEPSQHRARAWAGSRTSL